jgi:EAL domain-containing protein (putative c-di-GMP-specific phosphodiesterase class I)
VNLSDSQFHDANLTDTVAHALTETKFPAELLDLELTETIVFRNPEHAITILQGLRALGIQLALDDFGTGFSSLRHLQQYPINALKSDQSFIRNIATNERDATITRTVIAMAHSLGLRILAEGVETQEQLDFLREHGCEEVQGFIVSQPLPPEQFIKFVDKHIATEAGRRFTSFRRFA